MAAVKKRLHPEQHVRKKKYKKRRKPQRGASLTGKWNRAREVWKEIPKFDGVYSVSTYGRVRRNKATSKRQTKRILDLRGPYYYGWDVTIHHEGKRHRVRVRRLVVEAFAPHLIGKRLKFKDGDPTNVSPSNIIEKNKPAEEVLTLRKVANIKAYLYNNLYSKRELTRRYRLPPGTVDAICDGKIYQGVLPARNVRLSNSRRIEILKNRYLAHRGEIVWHNKDASWIVSTTMRDNLNRYIVACWGCTRNVDIQRGPRGRVESGRCPHCKAIAPKEALTWAGLLNAREVLNGNS